MKSELQKELSFIAPHFFVETIWEHDDTASWSRSVSDVGYPGNALADEDPDDWQAWQSEVRVMCVAGGELIESSEYLGGTWEKFGDDPEKTNPDISGYENQMTQECFESTLKKLELMNGCEDQLMKESVEAIEFLKRRAQENYDKQFSSKK